MPVGVGYQDPTGILSAQAQAQVGIPAELPGPDLNAILAGLRGKLTPAQMMQLLALLAGLGSAPAAQGMMPEGMGQGMMGGGGEMPSDIQSAFTGA